MYEIEDNPAMKNEKVEMVCDAKMCDHMNPAIESLSQSFNLLVVGRPGSSKINFVVNLLKTGKYNDERRVLRKMFENVVACSPTDESELFEEFDMEFVNFVKELTDIESDDGMLEHS